MKTPHIDTVTHLSYLYDSVLFSDEIIVSYVRPRWKHIVEEQLYNLIFGFI